MARAQTKEIGLSPNRYIEKVNRVTGREIPGPIDPDDLLVHAHRDQNPIEVAAQVIASGFIRTTGRERAVERGLKAINEMAGRGAELASLFLGGRAFERKAKDFLGVKELDTVVIRGQARRDGESSISVVATGIFIKKK